MPMHRTTIRGARSPRSRLTRLPGAGALPLIAVAAVALAACSSTTPSASSGKGASTTTAAAGTTALAALETPPSTPVSLTETGSTLLYPLFNLWAPAYSRLHQNISITTAGTGSGTGISQAAAGTVDIGASDAYLSPAQVQQTPGLLNIPLAISAQMVDYNLPGLGGTLKLNGQVLSDIYQGSITHWNDPKIADINPGITLPGTTVVPVHRSDGSGDTFIFSQYLSKADPSGWGQKIGYGTTVAFPAVAGALGENGNGGMVSGCAATPGCVAYIGISFQSQTQQKGLGQVELQNGSGNYVALTSQTVAAEAASFAGSTPASGAISLVYGTSAASGYPIINYEYAIVNSKQPDANTAQAVKALLAWAMDSAGGSAPSFLDKVQFQALPPSAITVAIALLSQIK
ncbi:MAG: phosphate ABC transporter substrate-binding protein PstS [Acidimicrobiales bacterium]